MTRRHTWTAMARRFVFGFLALVALHGCGTVDSGDSDDLADSSVHTYVKTDGPDRNPQKGWNTGWWDDASESSVGFQYLAWKDFEPENGTFDLNAVEALLDRPGTRGRHFVLRLYCDWFGENEASSGCPAWLYEKNGVRRLQGSNGRYVTDYNDPEFVQQAVQAIRALAQAYDRDPRAGAFQLGLLGFWGEWHTFGSEFDGSRFEIHANTMQTILDAYTSSFSHSQIQGRYPWSDPLQSAGGIGFHNDYFVPNDGHSDQFDQAIAANSLWQNGPIGGEAPPRSGVEAADEIIALFEDGRGARMIETGHYSTMKPGAYRRLPGDNGYDEYLRLHKLMGYNFQIETATFPDRLAPSEELRVHLEGTNVGVAPLYYDWDIQFALLDENGAPVALTEVAIDLRLVLPGSSFAASGVVPLDDLKRGAHRLAIRIIQPEADAPKPQHWKLDARNAYILLSNEMMVVQGAWDSKNALVGGWMVLGTIDLLP